MAFDYILVVEDDDSGSTEPAHYTFCDEISGTRLHPECVVAFAAIEAYPEDHDEVFELLDEGAFCKFPDVERRLRELRPQRLYYVTVVFNVLALNEDEACERVEDEHIRSISRRGTSNEHYYVEDTGPA